MDFDRETTHCRLRDTAFEAMVSIFSSIYIGNDNDVQTRAIYRVSGRVRAVVGASSETHFLVHVFG